MPKPTDGRKPKKIPFNEANFKKREFQELWGRINHKAVYQVEFDSAELIRNCIRVLDSSSASRVMQYLVEAGKQASASKSSSSKPAPGSRSRDEGRALGRVGAARR